MSAINEIFDEKSVSVFVGGGLFGYLKVLGLKEKEADKIVKSILPPIVKAIKESAMEKARLIREEERLLEREKQVDKA